MNTRLREARTFEYTVPGTADPRDGLENGRYFFGGYFASNFFASAGSFCTSFEPVDSSSRYTPRQTGAGSPGLVRSITSVPSVNRTGCGPVVVPLPRHRDRRESASRDGSC